MPIKSWNCPSCNRDFIVDSDAARDTCPWCHAAIEEKDGGLRSAEPAKTTSSGSSDSKSDEQQPSTEAHSSNSSGQSWWPFEYSS